MTLQHSRDTVVTLGGYDLTVYSSNSDLEFGGDVHDVTVYGKNSHVFRGGLKSGTATVTGFYDNTAVTGPRAVMLALYMTNATLIHRPEGTGSGRPQDLVDVVVGKYKQTSPVADMVTWTVDLTFSDDVNSTPQA
jgi:hypothetical protein